MKSQIFNFPYIPVCLVFTQLHVAVAQVAELAYGDPVRINTSDRPEP